MAYNIRGVSSDKSAVAFIKNIPLISSNTDIDQTS